MCTGFFCRDNVVPGARYERRLVLRTTARCWRAGVEMQNRGTTWESGLTHLSVHVTGLIQVGTASWGALLFRCFMPLPDSAPPAPKW